jgi:hypothetical protein
MTATSHVHGSCGVALLVALLGCADASHAELGATRAALSGGASELWGEGGELFDAKGRLMDWSYAGYRAGEAKLPERAATLSVLDLGAVPDDGEDDTAGLKAALAMAHAGDVVHLPAGVYVLREPLELTNGVVLAGDGSDQTVIEVPVSLTDLYGNPGLERGGSSSYAFGGAFLKARGHDDGDELAQVTAAAERGDTFLALSSTEGIEVGAWLHVDQTDVNGELIERLHADLQQGGDDNTGDKATEHYSRVKAIRDGGIELERPLPVDVELGWSPRVRAFHPSISELGIEHLTVRFPETRYPGHFKEQGYNAIELGGVFHSWVRDVKVVNGDYGVSITSSHFVTVADVVIDTTNDRSGHHALNCGHGGDNLYIGFDVRVPFVHDLTVEWYTTGNVFTQGQGKNLSLDHHRAAPYSTLWTELDLGAGTSAWKSGGAGNRGPHSAAYDTLWNVRAERAMAMPPSDYGPRMAFVGFLTSAGDASSDLDWWFEAIDPEALTPANLWLAMRERRLGPADADAGSGEDAGTGEDPGDSDDASQSGDGEADGASAPGDQTPGGATESATVVGSCSSAPAGPPGFPGLFVGLAALLGRRRTSRGRAPVRS